MGPSARYGSSLPVTVFAALFISAPETHAFDCGKASTPTEKAICADAEALAANDAMETAYFALRDRLAEAGAAMLVEGQRQWLQARNAFCEAEAVCLAAESHRRAGHLSGTPEGMVPFYRWRDGGPGEYRIRIAGYRFVSEEAPGAQAYGWALEELIGGTPLDQPADEDIDFPRPFEHELNVNMELLTPSLLSAVGYTYDYSGGAHPNSWTKAINIDRQTGRPLNLALTFGRATVAALADDCAGQIARDRMAIYDSASEPDMLRQLEEEYPGEVLRHAADIERWHFTPAEAVLRFDPYAIGPYAAGPFTCQFPIERIRDLAADPALFATR